ncbi:efflux RND transporter periplasmic adaptor subunit [Dichotomicrobium thermohalophilum]|uniref:RND family efflux transporter MFP subunit n=1 Tax=Dichotomicrobium thermohalophilum TaxID=933063 RepID=A0A397Q2X2_9HYPH|nr:efflux RND transporter periplasmic adaptor subunit [Dichotomicrobium thermohalophilum]RIA55398.1 RND family efflux transporter MFP subunit [Dichotomicrobium thermohalophilum]
MTDEARAAQPKGLWRSLGRHLLVLIAAGVIVSAAAGGIAVLHMRALAEAPVDANPPLTVRTMTLDKRDEYATEQRFAGRIEAARETRVAFERRGLVDRVLFDEGDEVQAGAPVAELDQSKLKAERKRLEANKRELQARLALAERTLERQSTLSRQGWQSEQRFDEARFAVDELNATIEKIAAQIEAIDIDLEKSVLRAPFAGTVTARHVDEGAVVQAGAPVLGLAETSRIHARIGVTAAVAEELVIGQSYPLAVGDRPVRGKLVAERPDIQTGTRTVTALFAIDNPGAPLGEVIELIRTRTIQQPGAWLPLTALVEDRRGLWSVYRVRGEGEEKTVQRRTVEVLHSRNGRAFVRGLFADGEQILRDGTNRVVPGQRVILSEKIAEN